VFFVEARYHRDPEKVPQQIRYISHREERLPSGERRELFGVGDRYRALRGDEKAIEKSFAEDSKGLRRPAYFRFILTVDNRAAERFARLDGVATERAVRDAIEKTFRGAARDVQGVLAIHQHGGDGRPSHPHVHALLSPRLQNGAPIHFAPRAIERVKQRWEIEVLRSLERHERRLVRRHPQRELMPLTQLRQRGFKARQGVLRVEPHSPRLRRLGPLTLAFLRSRPSRRVGKLAGRSADAALGFLDRAMEINRDPERVARRVSLRLLSKALAAPMRNTLWLARGVASFGAPTMVKGGLMGSENGRARAGSGRPDARASGANTEPTSGPSGAGRALGADYGRLLERATAMGCDPGRQATIVDGSASTAWLEASPPRRRHPVHASYRACFDLPALDLRTGTGGFFDAAPL